jgi:hypothetical protein
VTDFLSILADNGLVTLGDSFSDGKATFVRDVYNAVKQGDTVVVFSHAASDDLIASATEAAEASDTSAVVLQSHEVKRKGKAKGNPYSAADLKAAIDRRNGNNPSAPGDTWGSVTFASPMYDGAELIGFAVQ